MQKIKFLIFLIIGLAHSHLLASEEIQVLDAAQNEQTSYVTSELNGPLGFWVIDGKVFTLFEAKKLILKKDKIVCATWLMNYSDDKDASKVGLQKSLLQPLKRIPLWKIVSGRPIYVDPITSYALSFVCVGRDSEGQLIEIDATDFRMIFSGLYLFTDIKKGIKSHFFQLVIPASY